MRAAEVNQNHDEVKIPQGPFTVHGDSARRRSRKGSMEDEVQEPVLLSEEELKLEHAAAAAATTITDIASAIADATSVMDIASTAATCHHPRHHTAGRWPPPLIPAAAPLVPPPPSSPTLGLPPPPLPLLPVVQVQLHKVRDGAALSV